MSDTGNEKQAGGSEQPAGKEATRPLSPRDEHLDERLDEALDETFPASDPIAVHDPRPDGAPR